VTVQGLTMPVVLRKLGFLANQRRAMIEAEPKAGRSRD